ncbi:TolC family protein [Ferrimonas lipolytica]|uniref:TolC family protein n=1 Tax=Ferrimonas lipolytica TaxID=2724191 RepID=A0A6H1U988_9GAMM|nr:TolC family protein [Ferrimonas lipolytica]QIZ75615.1 TolC family protein [Ferrimonas lipolytica]
MTYQLTAVALILLLLSGCQSFSADDHREAIEQAQAQLPAWQSQNDSAQTATELSQLLSDPQLDQLIAASQAANPSLQQTLLSLQIAYAQQQLTRGDRLPSVDLGLATSDGEDGSSNSAELSVSWELDLWRKLADADSAAKMDLASNEASWQQAQDLLVANVMRGYLNYAQQQQLVVLEQQRLQLLQSNEAVILERYRVGLGDLEALDNAKTSTATTQATIALYQQQLANSIRTLQQLTGDSELSVAGTSTYPHVSQPLATLPIQDLSRRPDLQAAYFNTQSAYYSSKVAYKSMLPSISLQAALTDSANSMQDALFTSPAWSLLGQLTAPLYQGGQLKAQAEIAELESAQSYWAYREILLAAVLEVDEAIDNERNLSAQIAHLDTAVRSATRSSDSYLKKYRQGLVDIVDLLSVQQQQFDVESQQIQATYNHLVNRIDLGLALGLGVNQ